MVEVEPELALRRVEPRHHERDEDRQQVLLADRLAVDAGLQEVGDHVELGIARRCGAGRRAARRSSRTAAAFASAAAAVSVPARPRKIVRTQSTICGASSSGRPIAMRNTCVGKTSAKSWMKSQWPWSRNFSIVSRQAWRAIGVRRSTDAGREAGVVQLAVLEVLRGVEEEREQHVVGIGVGDDRRLRSRRPRSSAAHRVAPRTGSAPSGRRRRPRSRTPDTARGSRPTPRSASARDRTCRCRRSGPAHRPDPHRSQSLSSRPLASSVAAPSAPPNSIHHDEPRQGRGTDSIFLMMNY